MRILSCCTAMLIACTPMLAAQAQTDAPAAAATTLKVGTALYSSDSKRIGRVERIVADRAGTPGWATVIFNSRFVSVPVSTLSPSDKGFVSTLSKAEVSRLK